MQAPRVADAGCTFLSGDDADDGGHCDTPTACGGLMPYVFVSSIAQSRVVPAAQVKDILVIGAISSTAVTAFNSWRTAFPTATFDFVTGPAIATANFSRYRMIYMPSDAVNTGGGLPCSDVDRLNARAADIASYVNIQGGSLVSLTQS